MKLPPFSFPQKQGRLARSFWHSAGRFFSASTLAKLAFVLIVTGTALWLNRSDSSRHFDFGDVAINQIRSHEFLIPNKGKTAIYLTNASTSCECTTVLGAPSMVGPGMAGSFAARLQPKNAGSFKINIRLSRPEWWKRDLRYQISGRIVAPKPAWIRSSGDLLKNNLVSAEELMLEKTKTASLIVVDVRSESDYEVAHIPGSLALPLRAISTLKNKKDQRIVLIDQGNTSRNVLEEIVRLKSEGFRQVQLLDGGMAAWKKVGGAVMGSDLSNVQWGLLDPQEVFVSSDPSWLVVDAGGKSSRLLNEYFGDSETSVFRPGSNNYAKKLAALAGKDRKILILTSGGENYALMQSSLGKDSAVPVYYMAGGLEGYQNFLKNRMEGREHTKVTLAQKPVNRTLGGITSSQPSGCATCP